MAMNEWALLGVVLNAPLLAYLLIRWWFISLFKYGEPTSQPSNQPTYPQELQSLPVSGAGPPVTGTGSETG